MPNGQQADILDALVTVKYLGIESIVVNIGEAYNELVKAIPDTLSPTTFQNIPPRLRMATLYAVAQERRLLVCCTSNLSEKTIGYTTKWGDNVGDFSPIAHLTKSEVVEVGVALGLPLDLVNKIPADGLTGMTDEESIGFSYLELDDYIRNALENVPAEVAEKIEQRIAANRHKRLPIPTVR
jgi:NAD+ synthase